jgi:hypothetical protein
MLGRLVDDIKNYKYSQTFTNGENYEADLGFNKGDAAQKTEGIKAYQTRLTKSIVTIKSVHVVRTSVFILQRGPLML